MKAQPVFRRQILFPRQRIVVRNAAQRLQHLPALFRKLIYHLSHLPSSVREAVREQGFDSLRRVTR